MIRRLKQETTFPLRETELTDFENLRQEIEKATALIEAMRKWNHSATPHLSTDQRSVSFRLNNRKHIKIKNSKIQCRRLELVLYKVYRLGKNNAATDVLNRAYCASASGFIPTEITMNLPLSTGDVCRVCLT